MPVPAVESIPNAVLLVCQQPGPAINDRNTDEIADFGRFDAYGRTGWRILRRVLDKLSERPFDQKRVHPHKSEIVGHHDLEWM